MYIELFYLLKKVLAIWQMFLEHQINILEWFLKDYVTLRTENAALPLHEYIIF